MDLKNTFDSLKDRAVDLAQAGVAQSKRLAEIARLKMDNMSQQDAVKKAYIEIGKLYYAERGLSPDGAYAAACERITAARAAIEANNERIAELRKAEEEDPSVPEEDIVAQPAAQGETEAAPLQQPEEETQANKTEE